MVGKKNNFTINSPYPPQQSYRSDFLLTIFVLYVNENIEGNLTIFYVLVFFRISIIIFAQAIVSERAS